MMIGEGPEHLRAVFPRRSGSSRHSDEPGLSAAPPYGIGPG